MTPGQHLNAAPAGFQWLGLSLPLWVFVVLLAAMPFVAYQAMNTHAEKEALRDANKISGLISLMRSYYNTSVAQRVLMNGGRQTVLSENYHQIDGGIPIPATLSIELGNLIQQRELDDGFSMAFVSDAPFTSRQRPPLDAFQAEALNTFRQDPALNEVWQVVPNSQGGKDVRLAIPVRMDDGCVACHNGHPASPIRSWKTGDIRGLQDVTVAVQFTEQSEESLAFLAFLALFVGSTFFVLADHRRANRRRTRLIDELQRSQRQLESSETQLKRQVSDLTHLTNVLDRAPFGVAFSDPRLPGRPVTYVNEAFCQLTGYHASEWLDQDLIRLTGPATQADALQRLEDAIRKDVTTELEMCLHAKDGTDFWCRVLTFPSHDRDGWLINTVLCFTDISPLKAAESERQKMAAELQESLKLESLSITIAGIAHDLNTPVGVAMTASSHAERQLKQLKALVDQPEHDLSALEKAVSGLQKSMGLVGLNLGKAAALVRSFKQTTTDSSRVEWRAVELKPYLESLLLSLSPILRRSECQCELICPERLQIHTEPGSLMQIVTNLVVNATIHAFEGISDRRIGIEVTDGVDMIQMVIWDNGNGMPEEAISKAFTPFFTTRRQSGGSGLGLFSTRRSVEQVLGGRIDIISQRGAGTRFTIQIPKK